MSVHGSGWKLAGFACVLGLALLCLSGVRALPARADSCPTFDYSQYNFKDGARPNRYWQLVSGGRRVIKWAVNPPTLGSYQVTRPFTADEESWIALAIKGWDDVSNLIDFQQVSDPSAANLTIAWAVIPQPAGGVLFGFWNVRSLRTGQEKAIIALWDTAPMYPLFTTQAGFVHAVQNELGNILGLPDIRPTIAPAHISVLDLSGLTTTYTPGFEIGEFDTGLLRQLYGESTCSSAATPPPSVPATTTVAAATSTAATTTIAAAMTTPAAPRVLTTPVKTPAPTTPVKAPALKTPVKPLPLKVTPRAAAAPAPAKTLPKRPPVATSHKK